MSKKLYTILAAVLITVSTFAQTPEKMSYQAVVRDSGGNLVTSQPVGMQISILQTSATGTAVYVETQTPTSNVNGLVTLEIGTGSVVSGDFSTIDWSADTYFVKTETDPTGGSSYAITGTSQLLSVPYALQAKKAISAENGVPTGGTQGQVLTLNSSGEPVWADAYTGTTFYEDTDGDGYGDNNSTFVAFGAPNGYVSNNSDCNDSDATINPDTVWYLDADTDNFAASTVTQCTSPGIGYATTVKPLGDCNDSDASINPDTVWYLDADGDNYAASTVTQCASPGIGYSTTVLPVTDCDDSDASINPDTVWYLDADGDNYAVTLTQCTSPGIGYTTTVMALGDCNDSDATINPDTIWYLDNDNDGFGDVNTSETGCTPTLTNATQNNTDCNDSDASINPDTVWYLDNDNDGYGDVNTSETGCTPTLTNATQNNTDCNDSDASINPAATEVFDGIDNNCDGQIDEASIGEFRNGGVVFWVDPTDNTHGLVCAVDDQSSGIHWWNGSGVAVIAARNETIGAGATNTDAIIAAQGPVETNYAAGLARAYSGGGFNDWFLPSKNELNEMYLNRATINTTATANGGAAFTTNDYWSSTERVIGYSWGQLFNDGVQNIDEKTNVYTIRAVRAF